MDKAATVRCRRSDCGSAFRQYPQEIDRNGQIRRMRGWAALARALREPPAAVVVSVSRMSARRGVQEAGRNARRKQTGRVPPIGEDETVVRVKGEKTVIGAAMDAATGEVLGLNGACGIRPPKPRLAACRKRRVPNPAQDARTAERQPLTAERF